MSETKTPVREELLDWLRPVQDPELFMSLVDLGLVYEVELSGGSLRITMTLTSPGCPAADHLVSEVRKRALEHPQVRDAEVQLVFEPKWDPRTMASDEVKDSLGIW